MAVSRPFLIALLGAVLVAALFLATIGRGSADDSASSGPPPVEQTTKPPKPASTAAAKPAAKAKSQAAAAASPTKATRGKPAAQEKAKAKDSQSGRAGLPLNVERALAKKRTVVLFFRQQGSADDDATARAVASLRGRRGLAVFSAPISRLADYRAIADRVGVSQAPSVVIVGRKGARLVEGFVDRETLAQEVADSR